MVRDHSTWLRWTDIQSIEIESTGDADPNGVGAVRKIIGGSGAEIRERIVEIVEGRAHPVRTAERPSRHSL
ncbi:hypothetical protein [Sphingopyxis sp. PET50]|uniref:hypothetical protein n=1 Tax=Sphingopyxis sp. PET50 TaxID=2976533 RepID=UPI0039199201